MRKLNLGCGPDIKKGPGWVNLDYNSEYNPEVVHNIDKFPYPFKDKEFDYIYCSHILEHVGDIVKTMEELLRILKVGGTLHIKVPHFSNGNGYNDLTHKRFFGWRSFDSLNNGYLKKLNFKIIKQRYNWLSGRFKGLNFLVSWIFNIQHKGVYERFFCWVFPVGEIELVLKKN